MGLKDERGMMAIGVALMLIVVLALFGGVLWQYSMAEMKRVERAEHDMQALFLARAGAEAVMSAWFASEPGDRPPLPITVDPIYYNTDTGFFSSQTKPADYLGLVNVVIDRENVSDDENKKMYATVIEAVARVGGITRTVRLMTHPHRYGHELGWYDENDGKITGKKIRGRTKYDLAPGELVVMQTDFENAETSKRKPIYIGKDTKDDDGSGIIPFVASYLIFDSELNLSKNANNLANSPRRTINVALTAEIVFIDGLVLTYLPAIGFGILWPAEYYGVQLRLPNGAYGLSGYEISEIIQEGEVLDFSAKYGEVYFENNPVELDEFTRSGFLGNVITDKKTYDLGLAGRAFYFKNGTRLDPKAIYDHIQKYGEDAIGDYFTGLANSGKLIPIPEDKQLSREDLEGMQPFFWDR